MSPIGLISAIPAETAHLLEVMERTDTQTMGGATFYVGRLEGVDIVLTESGMGKVNAAFISTLLLETFQCRLMLFCGVAGGIDPSLDVGDVVIGTHLIQHDYGFVSDAEHTSYHPGHLPILGPTDRLGWELDTSILTNIKKSLQDIEMPQILEQSMGGKVPQIVYGTIITGDVFLDCAQTRDTLFKCHQAQAIEMEGAAVAQVAEKYGAPTLIVRCLSDLAGAPARIDIEEFISDAGAVAAKVVRHLLPSL